MSDRIRIVPQRNADWGRRNNYGALNARGPIRTVNEVAAMLSLNHRQVRYWETSALNKIRAALVAYGYKKERA